MIQITRDGFRILIGVAGTAAVFGMMACSAGSKEGEPAEVLEVQAQALVETSKANESAAASAARETQERAAATDNYVALKQRVDAARNSDKATADSLSQQLATASANALKIPGAGGPIPGAKGLPVPVIEPAKYAGLRPKMAGYDMSKPADVAAWSNLKRKELGQ